MSQLVNFIEKGGPVMWPLLILTLVAIMFMIERFILLMKSRLNTDMVLNELKGYLEKKDVKGATNYVSKFKGPIASMLIAGLEKFDKGSLSVEKVVETTGTLEMTKLEKGLNILATISNIGPLLGFLGTVTGMIRSFEAIAKAGLNNPSAVALGISEALITTASGLIIAIPTLAAYNYFTSLVSGYLSDMENASTVLLDYAE